MSSLNQRGTTEFNGKFAEFDHYKMHPQMMPFVGKHWNAGKKLLLIGESHYINNKHFGDEYAKHKTARRWYDAPVTETPLSEKAKIDALTWTDTATIMNWALDNPGKAPGHRIYQNIYFTIREAMRESGFASASRDDVFPYIAYANFFQRPADSQGDSIANTPKDNQRGNAAMRFIVDAIKPNYLFIMSSKAWDAFDKTIFDPANTGRSPHPTNYWWNRASRKYASKCSSKEAPKGKEAFIDFLRYHKVFE